MVLVEIRRLLLPTTELPTPLTTDFLQVVEEKKKRHYVHFGNLGSSDIFAFCKSVPAQWKLVLFVFK
jgi:hypothetical protein